MDDTPTIHCFRNTCGINIFSTNQKKKSLQVLLWLNSSISLAYKTPEMWYHACNTLERDCGIVKRLKYPVKSFTILFWKFQDLHWNCRKAISSHRQKQVECSRQSLAVFRDKQLLRRGWRAIATLAILWRKDGEAQKEKKNLIKV